MSSLQTTNPAFSNTIFAQWEHADRRGTVMTAEGTAGKALALLLIVTATAAVSWNLTQTGQMSRGLAFGAALVGFVFALMTCFKPTWAPVTAPIYSAFQGVFLGAVSNAYNQQYSGIVFQAISLTFATSFVMFFVYATGLIRVTGRLAGAITAATGALFLFYLVSFVASQFFSFHAGANAISGSSPLGLAISGLAVGLAAFNLLLDFDFIDRGARGGAPKSMEWYGAFGLMVTLIWLYVSLLRLLAKLQDRR